MLGKAHNADTITIMLENDDFKSATFIAPKALIPDEKEANRVGYDFLTALTKAMEGNPPLVRNIMQKGIVIEFYVDESISGDAIKINDFSIDGSGKFILRIGFSSGIGAINRILEFGNIVFIALYSITLDENEIITLTSRDIRNRVNLPGFGKVWRQRVLDLGNIVPPPSSSSSGEVFEVTLTISEGYKVYVVIDIEEGTYVVYPSQKSMIASREEINLIALAYATDSAIQFLYASILRSLNSDARFNAMLEKAGLTLQEFSELVSSGMTLEQWKQVILNIPQVKEFLGRATSGFVFNVGYIKYQEMRQAILNTDNDLNVYSKYIYEAGVALKGYDRALPDANEFMALKKNVQRIFRRLRDRYPGKNLEDVNVYLVFGADRVAEYIPSQAILVDLRAPDYLIELALIDEITYHNNQNLSPAEQEILSIKSQAKELEEILRYNNLNLTDILIELTGPGNLYKADMARLFGLLKDIAHLSELEQRERIIIWAIDHPGAFDKDMENEFRRLARIDDNFMQFIYEVTQENKSRFNIAGEIRKKLFQKGYAISGESSTSEQLLHVGDKVACKITKQETNLPSGKVIFRVTITNQEGVCCEKIIIDAEKGPTEENIRTEILRLYQDADPLAIEEAIRYYKFATEYYSSFMTLTGIINWYKWNFIENPERGKIWLLIRKHNPDAYPKDIEATLSKLSMLRVLSSPSMAMLFSVLNMEISDEQIIGIYETIKQERRNDKASTVGSNELSAPVATKLLSAGARTGL